MLADELGLFLVFVVQDVQDRGLGRRRRGARVELRSLGRIDQDDVDLAGGEGLGDQAVLLYERNAMAGLLQVFVQARIADGRRGGARPPAR